MSRLQATLENLQDKQLVHALASGEEYVFKHALTQEAACDSLLIKRRRAVHAMVARAYEALFPDSLDDYAAVLAEHFAQAGDSAKTLSYAIRAAQAAERVFANAEAAAQYTRALAAAREQAQPDQAILLARGGAYERVGLFERAEADYQAAKKAAESRADVPTQWQAHLNLGFLWLGVDYGRAGEFFRRAQQVAETLQDPRALAHTLNRIANVQMNIGLVTEGNAGHHRALEIFQRVGDRKGTAETLDLLGMAEGMVGNRVAGRHALDQAVRLFRALGDQQGLAGTLLTRIAFDAAAMSVGLGRSGGQKTFQRDLKEASAIVKQTGWAAGEAMLGLVGGLSLASFGQVGRGLHECERGLRVATEIGHKQWRAGAQFALGQIHVDLGDLHQGAQYAEAGLTLARELNSAWWIGHSTTALCQARLRSGDLDGVVAELAKVFPREAQPTTLVQRRLLSVWVEWEMARGNTAGALELVERTSRKERTPFLMHLEGQVLLELGEPRRALPALQRARDSFAAQEARLYLWNVLASLGGAHAALGEAEAARREYRSARRMVQELAATIDDADLRSRFLTRTARVFPAEGEKQKPAFHRPRRPR